MKTFESLNDSKFAKFEGNAISNLHATKGGIIVSVVGGSTYSDRCTGDKDTCDYTAKADRIAQL